MEHAPTVRGDLVQVDALRNLSAFEDAIVRPIEEWPGMTGHPLQVVDALASHLFGRYSSPRFFASAWFGRDTSDRVERRRWFVAHAQGFPFRRLALPIPMTRQMVHTFLNRTPDHFAIDHALRRAEIVGLGGSPELADAILTTHLTDDFSEAERWQAALKWLVNCGDTVDLTQVRPFIDFLGANLHAVDLRGRTFSSAMRLVRAWHGWLGHSRSRLLTWSRSRWNEMTVAVEPTPTEPRRAEWQIVELLDSHQLEHEGRVMRHCVATYARACATRYSSIWSLRHRWCDEPAARSVITIEVHPATRMIVQVRGPANSIPRGAPFELVRRWAARERLQFQRSIATGDGAGVALAA